VSELLAESSSFL